MVEVEVDEEEEEREASGECRVLGIDIGYNNLK
jgi:hypothetical protein